MRVIVVGAGVIGLTCAVRCAEAGYDVHVLARDLPLETTSSVAAALWYPYRAHPREQVTRWSARTYDVLAELAARDESAGVRVRRGRELLREPSGGPWWRAAVPALDRIPAAERPAGYADGWVLAVPVVDMSRYLPWLAQRLEAAGGTLTRTALSALPATPGAVVVNASGLAARRLADDPAVRPVRGQVLRLAQLGLTDWTLDESDERRPVYVVPRIDDVVVGGTADEDAWDRTPDPATAAEVLARATALVPELAGARVLAHRVGLRPVRPAVRLETRWDGDAAVVHCYGHGGAGVTLSWGCADDVLEQVRAAVAR